MGQTRMRKSQIWILQRHAIFFFHLLEQLPSASLKQATKQEYKIAVCYQPGGVLLSYCVPTCHIQAFTFRVVNCPKRLTQLAVIKVSRN